MRRVELEITEEPYPITQSLLLDCVGVCTNLLSFSPSRLSTSVWPGRQRMPRCWPSVSQDSWSPAESERTSTRGAELCPLPFSWCSYVWPLRELLLVLWPWDSLTRCSETTWPHSCLRVNQQTKRTSKNIEMNLGRNDDVVLLLIIVYLTWKLVVYTLYCPYMHKYSYMTVWADVLERV